MALRRLLSLGAGATAEVFLARADGGRLVAVKIAHKATASSEPLRRLFLAEADAARQVRHPRLVACLATAHAPLAMVLRYVEGPSLAELSAACPLPLPCALRVLIDVAEGLAALNAEGRTHGDLCPRNVLVDRHGETCLTDFGAADAAPAEHAYLGTVGYAAPEVCRGARCDARADCFSLGVLMWELMRGERLHCADELTESVRLWKFAETPAPALDHDRPDLARYAPLAAQLLTLDPAQRTIAAREVAVALSTATPVAERPTLASHVVRAFADEAQRRENALNAVAARYGDG